MEPLKSWGYHYIANYSRCNLEKITDADNVKQFSKALVDAIDMVAYGEPQVVNFGTEDKAGFTLVQLIETSNICAHFCNETGDVYLDVFSCKEFDPEIVNLTFTSFFQPQNGEIALITRQA